MNAFADIIKPGLSTSIQDMGRSGFRHLGVPLSGAADFVSLAVANAAIGNSPHAAGLECTLNGPTLKFTGAVSFALGGADMAARLNGKPVPLYEAVKAHAGDELILGAASTGARAYIAFAGGLSGDEFLGAKSTYAAAALGGHSGRALKKGDQLINAGSPAGTPREIPAALKPNISHEFFLRALPGPEASSIDRRDAEIFFSAKWTLSRRADRMGAQLDGPQLSATAGAMASSPVFSGTVQAPPGGAPFLLLCDAQTVGGYPRLAQIIAADLPLAGQMRPGDRVWFWKISDAEARDIAVKKAALFSGYLPDGFFR